MPGLAGFFSKDEILFRTFAGGHTLLWIDRPADVAADGDLHVPPRVPRVPRQQAATRSTPNPARAPPGTSTMTHLHDAPPAMALALIVLAFGSVVAGYAGLPHALGGSNRFEHFLGAELRRSDAAKRRQSAEKAPSSTLMVGVRRWSPSAASRIAAFFFLKRQEAARRAGRSLRRRSTACLQHKYYVDEIYDAAIVQPIRVVSGARAVEGRRRAGASTAR